MHYRTEIDGLRAIAVISVILYHAEIVIFDQNWFVGGFIGVDIFFVISGYLISRLLFAELFAKESINFLAFYERRARRILPLLLTVMIVSLPFAWQSLLPNDFIEYSYSILSALFFGSNFFFYQITAEYGADSSLLKPFLHTWSLGVEEQFYIFFPLLTLFIYSKFRHFFLSCLFVIFFCSLIFSQYMVYQDKQFTFYLPMSRFWQLLAGSILAYIELKQANICKRLTSPYWSFIGLLTIIASILWFDSQTPHPSIITLLPILGTVMVIATTANKSFIGQLLSYRPLVAIGLISYSLYLWHFPVFAFARLEQMDNSNYDKFMWIAITVLLSITSYFLVEKFFRNRELIKTGLLIFFLSLSGFIIIAVHIIAIDSRGFNNRFNNIQAFINSAQLPQNYAKHPYEKGRNCGTFEFDQRCIINSLNTNKKIYLVGDSHAYQHTVAIHQTLIKEFPNYGLEIIAAGSCGFNGLLKVREDNEKFTNQCRALNEKTRDHLLSVDQSIIIIANRWHGYKKTGKPYLADTLKDSLIEEVSRLVDYGHKVVLITNYKEAKKNPKELISQLSNNPLADKRMLKTFAKEGSLNAKDGLYNETFDTLRNYENVIIFDPTLVIQGNNNSMLFADGTSKFFDYHHFSQQASNLVIQDLLRILYSSQWLQKQQTN